MPAAHQPTATAAQHFNQCRGREVDDFMLAPGGIDAISINTILGAGLMHPAWHGVRMGIALQCINRAPECLYLC